LSIILQQEPARGADFIKVQSFILRDEYFAVVDETKKQHLVLAADAAVVRQAPQEDEDVGDEEEVLGEAVVTSMPWISLGESELTA
jgi:hypothetical protein